MGPAAGWIQPLERGQELWTGIVRTCGRSSATLGTTTSSTPFLRSLLGDLGNDDLEHPVLVAGLHGVLVDLGAETQPSLEVAPAGLDPVTAPSRIRVRVAVAFKAALLVALERQNTVLDLDREVGLVEPGELGAHAILVVVLDGIDAGGEADARVRPAEPKGPVEEEGVVVDQTADQHLSLLSVDTLLCQSRTDCAVRARRRPARFPRLAEGSTVW